MLNQLNHIGILGCGWLGTALLQDSRMGSKVKLTCASQDRFMSFHQQKRDAYLLDIYDSASWPMTFFNEIETLMILVPFRRGLTDPWVYPGAIESIINVAEQYSIKRLIFSSSTSVYPCLNQIASESERIEGDTERSKALLETEKLIINSSISSSVLRLGGLVGLNRHPGRFLANKKDVSGAENPVNLIHIDDLKSAIFFIESLEHPPEIINIVTPEKPNKRDFYTQMADCYGVEAPTFSDENPPYKVVSVQKLLDLGFKFKDPNPMNWDESIFSYE